MCRTQYRAASLSEACRVSNREGDEVSDELGDKSCEELCDAAASFYARGYAFGSTGNLSVRVGDRVWITPTGQSLKALKPAQLACVTLGGESLNENRPSKEFPFHAAIYRQRPEARAVVHLHSGWATALACLADLDEAEPLPPITPYYLMRVAPLGVLPYFRPGSTELAGAVERLARDHHCLLMRNHGTITAGATLGEAVDRAEELEATARLFFQLRGERVRRLTGEEADEIRRVFGGQASAPTQNHQPNQETGRKE
jgi:3-dehydro-4-phosphotetronate decarboxylase